jgi:hypothetical protein
MCRKPVFLATALGLVVIAIGAYVRLSDAGAATQPMVLVVVSYYISLRS